MDSDTWSWSRGDGKSINYDIKCIDVRAASDVFRSVNTLTQYTTVQQILNVKYNMGSTFSRRIEGGDTSSDNLKSWFLHIPMHNYILTHKSSLLK